jgi:hypothetical protein
VLNREQNREQTVRALNQAAELWGKFGNEKNAGNVAELAKKFSRHQDGKKEERTREERAGRKKSERRKEVERREEGERREREGERKEDERR